MFGGTAWWRVLTPIDVQQLRVKWSAVDRELPGLPRGLKSMIKRVEELDSAADGYEEEAEPKARAGANGKMAAAPTAVVGQAEDVTPEE
eukprot:4463106-Pyramimonas_sp.AAC.1